ncbi:hypothetical protein [Nonomuraea aridisoli]|uniref:Uncharacterized protein n=1 Tax=Nonomuraea aridisoli TaxID=2070368 RepID=A0A2W2E2V3_9ACTN|nr:hypothetical protein [Nonomuraea aridisoli]PZG18586.1 hypothetical protein C1J01_14580 [Nonomuraea aridisoli]
MRAGYSEPLAMLGYVVGMLVTPAVAPLVGDHALLGASLTLCEALFGIAFVVALVRHAVRGVRGLVRRGRRIAGAVPGDVRRVA